MELLSNLFTKYGLLICSFIILFICCCIFLPACAPALAAEEAVTVASSTNIAATLISGLLGTGGIAAWIYQWKHTKNEKEKAAAEYKLVAEKQYMDASACLQVKYTDEFQRLETEQKRLADEIVRLQIKVEDLSRDKTNLCIQNSRLLSALEDSVSVLVDNKITIPNSAKVALKSYAETCKEI